MLGGHTARRTELGLAVRPLQRHRQPLELRWFGILWGLFSRDLCWLGGESPKELSWPLRNAW